MFEYWKLKIKMSKYKKIKNWNVWIMKIEIWNLYMNCLEF